MSKKSKQALEFMKWYFKFRLQNGFEGCYQISTEEKDSLEKRLPLICDTKGIEFFELDSLSHRILIQGSQLVFFQFLFEPLSIKEPQAFDEDDRDSYAVKIYFTDNRQPMTFYVDIDEPDPKEEGDEGQMNNFIFYALHLNEDSELLHFTDEDGETAFFRGASLALIEIPLNVLQPDENPEEQG